MGCICNTVRSIPFSLARGECVADIRESVRPDSQSTAHRRHLHAQGKTFCTARATRRGAGVPLSRLGTLPAYGRRQTIPRRRSIKARIPRSLSSSAPTFKMLSLPFVLAASLLGLAAANPVEPRQIGPQSGDATYFDTSVGLGACGIQNNNNQFIAAVSHALFDTFPGYAGGNPNNNPICGRTATAHYNGRSITFAIEDRCAGCNGFGDIDLTPSAFIALVGSLDPGRVHGVTWSLN